MNVTVKVPCAGCTHCCQNELLLLHPKMGDDAASYETKVVRHPFTGEVARALKNKPNGDCWYLGETGCTIHGRHPAICREFDCRRMYLAFVEMPKSERKSRLKNLPGTAEQLAVGKAKLAAFPL